MRSHRDPIDEHYIEIAQSEEDDCPEAQPPSKVDDQEAKPKGEESQIQMKLTLPDGTIRSLGAKPQEVEAPPSGPEEHWTKNPTEEQIPRLAGIYAQLARNRFYLKNRSESNVIMVREFIMREMMENNVRRKDMYKVLPYAVKLAFVPGKHEVSARQMTLTNTYQELDYINGARLWHRTRPTFTNWFGKLVMEPEETRL